MKHLRLPLLFLCLLAVLALAPAARAGQAGTRLVVSPQGPYTSIVDALADALPGDVIEVRGGVHPAPLVVDKAVTLEGVDWPVLDGGGQGTVVTLSAAGSGIRGFEVRGSGVEPDQDHAGLTLQAPRTFAENNRLTDVLFGIFVSQADDAMVRGNEITGKTQYEIGRKGDGIRLWYSQNVTVEGNHVYDVRDVVIWYSSGVSIRGNTIERGRYGIHLMYDDNALVQDNQILDNSVGIYTMYTTATTLRDNLIRGQRGPSGYGLAFKDTNDVLASGNVLVDNRAGFFIDGTPFQPEAGGFAQYTDNIVAFNDVGVIIQPSVKGNMFSNNTFWENAEQVSIQGGGGQASWNIWQGNSWSDYSGFDADGDGNGDSPYQSERLFENLYDREARLRALIYSPAIQAIEFAGSAFPIVRPQTKLIDSQPRINPGALPPYALSATHDGGMLPAALLVLLAGLGCGLAARLPLHIKPHIRKTDMASSDPDSQPLITARHVTKRYGKVRALHDVSFEARAGEAVALWGPNGAGKTTLLKALLSLIRFEGDITIAGEDVRRRGKQARGCIGYVPQEAVFYDWTVRETMSFYARLKRADSGRIAGLLERLGLAEHIAKRVPDLSGGLKQRLALAVALLSDPPVLLLDEPTANLDAKARRNYLELLTSLRADGKLILFASHRFEELDILADRVLMLEDGSLVDTMAPAALRERIAPELELTLWIAEDQRASALDTLTGQGFEAHFNGRGTVVVKVSTTAKAQPLEALNRQGITILDFEMEHNPWIQY